MVASRFSRALKILARQYKNHAIARTYFRPGKWYVGKCRLDTLAIEAHFHYKQSVCGQMIRRAVQNGAHMIQSIGTARERHLRFVALFARQRRH